MTDEQDRARLEAAQALARNLAAVRRFRGLTQREVAAYLGLHPGSMANWEAKTPKGGPTLLQGAQLAELYGVSLDALVGRVPLELTTKGGA